MACHQVRELSRSSASRSPHVEAGAGSNSRWQVPLEGTPPWGTRRLYNPVQHLYLAFVHKIRASGNALQSTFHPGAWNAWFTGCLRALVPHPMRPGRPESLEAMHPTQ